MPKLSDTKLRSLKPRHKPYKAFDTDNLYLLVNPSGGKWWRQRYRWAGKERLIGLGTYPEVGLAQAREKGIAIRKQVACGIDPAIARAVEKASLRDSTENTFNAVALAWHSKFKSQWSEGHAKRILERLETNAFPWIGAKPIRDVTSADIVSCLDRMTGRGAIDTARRVLQILKNIFKYAVARQLVPASPVGHIDARHVLPSVQVEHRAAIKEPNEFAALLRAIENYPGGFVVKCALKLLSLTFVRPGELRGARWEEFNLESEHPVWRIPAARMKMGGQDHLVPLSKQSIVLLREIQPLTGADGKGLVFPGSRNASRPLSENTLNAALRTLGFTQEQHTAHGFRGSASTMLNEQQCNKDAIELQLSHTERDGVRQAYNAADHLPYRREMMQKWADHLDTLRAGANVIPLRRTA